MQTKIIKIKTIKGNKRYQILIRSFINWEPALFKDNMGKKPFYFKSKKKAIKAERRLHGENIITHS